MFLFINPYSAGERVKKVLKPDRGLRNPRDSSGSDERVRLLIHDGVFYL